MDNVLEFYLKMKDMMSGGLIKVAQTAKESLGAVKTYTINLVKGSQEAGQSFDKLADKVKDTRKEVDKLKETGGGLKAALMGGLMALGLGGVVQQSLAQAAMKENQQIAFKVLTGSQAFGAQMYDNIVKMADTTPFESQDLARGAKTMLGYGVDKNKIMPNLNMLGNVASAQDNPAEALQSLSLAYGQVAAKGHLAGQEVLQMVNAGFNPLKEISDMTGKSMTELDKIMEKGGITIAMVDKAFQHATGEGGKFHDMMLLQSQTLGGQFSTFMDLIHSKMRAFGEFLAPAAKGLMQFAGAVLNSTPAMVGLAVGVGALAVAAMAAVPGIAAFTAAFMASPFAIIGAIAICVGLLIGAISSLTHHTDTAVESFQKLTDRGTLVTAMHKQASVAVSENIAKATMLLGIIRDDNMEQSVRIQKLRELRNLDKEHFGALTLTSSGTDAATKSLQAYTAEMWKHAEAMAAVDKYKEIVAQGLDAKMKIHDEVRKKIYGATTTDLSFGSLYGGNGGRPTFIRAANQDAQRKLDEQRQMAAIDKAQQGSLGFLMGSIKGDKGAMSGLGGGGTTGTGDGFGDTTAKGIASGGPRVININGVKFMDKIADHVNINNQGDMANIELQFQELFLRVLNSGASVQ